MDEHTLAILDFDRIRRQLADLARSGLGRELAERLGPKRAAAGVRGALAETTEAREIVAGGAQVPLHGLGDLRPLVARAEKGGLLNAAELVRVADCLRGTAEFKRYMAGKRGIAPTLSLYAESLVPQSDLAEEIYLATDGSRVADAASSRLAKIRKEIRVVEERIKSKLQSYLTAPGCRDALQESFVTSRQGRYTIPVKASHRHRIKGAVVESSGSGMTVYIEPAAIRKLTDELRILKGQEEAEEFQILTALTGLVAECGGQIRANLEIMAVYDLAFAKGKLSLAMAARPVAVRDDGFIQLLGARHPLLGAEVVPINVVIGNRYRSLVITGPNTGGKTVALKTVGLLTLMAGAGLHVPAGEGSAISVFDQVLVDIGDTQSIEQSLSTFSGHISRIAAILEVAGPKCLVLLDEIGTGTDPAEGAALAMGILEALHATNCVTIASTHYSDVKRLAAEHPGFVNGRMDFDRQTLKPLYRLVIGEAGESQALWIAGRLGIGDDVLARARGHLRAAIGDKPLLIDKGSMGEGSGGAKQPERTQAPEPSTPAPQAAAGDPGSPDVPGEGGDPGDEQPGKRRPWRLGDSVVLAATGQQGVIAVLPDEKGELVVFSRGQRIRTHQRRVKLIVGAEHLYPDGYDLRTVLFTWQERKEIKELQRKSREIKASDGAEWVKTEHIEVDRRRRQT